MKDKDIYSLGLVFLGNFNPVIITPQWLAAKGLIREIESDTAKIHLIHPEICRFEMDWLSFEATSNKLSFKTNRESHIPVLKDLVVSIFGILKETPINACGINHLSHFSLKDIEEYHKFGYWLSPVREFADILNDPKVLNIQYVETKIEGQPDMGVMKLVISPSDLILDKKSVLIACNHHFENGKKDAKSMLDIIVEKWDYSFQKSNKLVNQLWEKAIS